MGGIGKTTLARNVYTNPLTEYHFDIRVWITISQEYNILDILGVLLSRKNKESWDGKTEAELGEMLHKSLYGRRYLIVMDDMWSHELWDGIKRYFPNECNGSRIIVTTRLTNVASYLTADSRGLEMDFLDQDKSWSLLCKTVFGEEDCCPSELENVGKEISRNCQGLPLSIVVIGGLLAKSKQTHSYWKYIAENLNSVVNLEENERCFKILHTSYDELSAHLKACFLYMGVFPEDHEIVVFELIEMWVAESFLKPISGKDLEESAEEYLMDLAGRNLIMVHEKGHFRQEKLCNIHDLLRDLCIREARKEKFVCVVNQHNEDLKTQRRVAIHQGKSEKQYLDCLKGASTTRSLICYSRDIVSPLAELRLLRVFTKIDGFCEADRSYYRFKDIFGLVNLRYLSALYLNLVLPSSLSQFWNLQTLCICGLYAAVFAPPEIWKMPLIRHIKSDGTLRLPNPPSGHTDGRDDFALHELRTLVGVTNLKLSEDVIKRIPNVNKLGMIFDYRYKKPLYLNNLDRLYKLEDLSLMFQFLHPPSRTELMQSLTFPQSLKKLALCQTELHWEDITMKIGSLPHLQMLILHPHSFIGPEWKTVEGKFCSLKYLRIYSCVDLKCWSTESTHFPCLVCLHLVGLPDLEEIPLCIGDIPTLKSIILQSCPDSAVNSAKRILDEQEELGNESLQVRLEC